MTAPGNEDHAVGTPDPQPATWYATQGAVRMKHLVFAGIGSRKTPHATLVAMRTISETLCRTGWFLRSGGAQGADSAFAAGAPAGQRLICLPWPGFQNLSGPDTWTLDAAARPRLEAAIAPVHPKWRYLRDGARKLHARNAAIIAGPAANAPADLVVCWTPGGAEIGGTATGIRYARTLGVPSLNLATTALDQVLATAAAIAAANDGRTTP